MFVIKILNIINLNDIVLEHLKELYLIFLFIERDVKFPKYIYIYIITISNIFINLLNEHKYILLVLLYM